MSGNGWYPGFIGNYSGALSNTSNLLIEHDLNHGDIFAPNKLMTMKKLNVLIVALILFSPEFAGFANEQDRVDQAANVIARFKSLPEKRIPRHIMRDARGFAIVTVIKGGFVFSGQIGEGVVVARTAHGWCGPSFIRTGGAGFGVQIGGEVTEFVLVLNTPEAVRAFSHDGNIQLGGALSAAAGPVGMTAAGSVMPTAAIYTYSRRQGLFAGASLEGAVFATNKTANQRYCGRRVSSDAILRGRVAPPKGAHVLLRQL